MQQFNSLELIQRVAKLIYQSRQQSRIDENFNIETNYIRKQWFDNKSNILIIQFFLKLKERIDLCEEWTIVQTYTNKLQPLSILDQIKNLLKQSPLSQNTQCILDHKLIINEAKNIDWKDQKDVQRQEIDFEFLSIKLAYLTSINHLLQPDDGLQFFKRERFLSDEFQHEKNHQQNRRTSFHDLDVKINSNRNMLILNNFKSNTASTNGSSQKTPKQLLTIVNKKDDFEILSSVEDAEKIIEEDQNGDFELVIDDGPEQKMIVLEDDRIAILQQLRINKKRFSFQIKILLDVINK
ncbi:hypothetical protein pb186bvf_009499 [Paramecium bursaria]